MSGVEVRLNETLVSFKFYESLNNIVIPCITALHVADVLPHILNNTNILECLAVIVSFTFQKGF